MEAFKVLPLHSGQPPPPTTPHSPRVAPRYRQQKESSAFVVLAEVGSGTSGRSSPFRGRGFKAPVVSKIPVKSAPSSPGPRAPKPAFGKSAPTTPSKRVTARQPSTPKKPLSRPVPKQRFLQNTVPKEDRSKAAPTKSSSIENKVIRKRSDTSERTSSNKKLNEGGTLMIKNLNVTGDMVAINSNDAADIVGMKPNDMGDMAAKTDRSRFRNLNEKNSTNNAEGKSSVTNNKRSNVPTTRVAKPAVGRIAVTIDRVNRLRPDKHMINSTRLMKRNSIRTKSEPPESNVNTDLNSSDKQQNTKSKSITAENESISNKPGDANKSLPRSAANIASNDLSMENDHIPLNNVSSNNVAKELMEEVKQVEVKIGSAVPNKQVEKTNLADSNQTLKSGSENALSNFPTAENNNILKLPSPYSTVSTSLSSNGLTVSTGSVILARDIENSSSSSHSSSQLTLVTGITQANVEPVKDTSDPPDHNTNSHDANVPNKKEVTTRDESGLDKNTTKEAIVVGAVEKDVANNVAELIPNGDIHGRHEVVNVINGGGVHQNKIIIHQSDMNGPVHVIGSEPLLISELDEVIKESIVTETAVPSEDLLLRKEAQPDLIPSGQVEEPQVTVVGQPDVEVEAGNHTVTFRYSRGNGSMETGLMPPLEYVEMKKTDGKISPEIHPVSARKNKRRSVRDLCGCCRPAARSSKGCSWRLPWFKKRNGPGPPQPPKVKKKRAAFSSLFSCTKCKGRCRRKSEEPKPPQSQTGLQEPKRHAEGSEVPKLQVQPKEKEKLCRRIFCCGCRKKGPTLAQLPAPKNKSYLGKLLCCWGGKRSDVRPRPQQSQELLKNRRREMSKSRTTSIQSGFSKLEMSLVEHSSMMRAAIPVLPICLAWTCLILNVFLPGTGTMTSGILCLCFGKPRFSVNDTPIARLGAFCVNLVIGFGQIFTIIFCLVGWGWSIWWGVIMLRLARKHRRIKLAEKNSIQPRAVNQNHDVERGH